MRAIGVLWALALTSWVAVLLTVARSMAKELRMSDLGPWWIIQFVLGLPLEVMFALQSAWVWALWVGGSVVLAVAAATHLRSGRLGDRWGAGCLLALGMLLFLLAVLYRPGDLFYSLFLHGLLVLAFAGVTITAIGALARDQSRAKAIGALVAGGLFTWVSFMTLFMTAFSPRAHGPVQMPQPRSPPPGGPTGGR